MQREKERVCIQREGETERERDRKKERKKEKKDSNKLVPEQPLDT